MLRLRRREKRKRKNERKRKKSKGKKMTGKRGGRKQSIKGWTWRS